MSAARQGSIGATRVCPHCKATILASASVCPACQHHLRFNPSAGGPSAGGGRPAGRIAMRIEGTIGHESVEQGCEYCVVVSITNRLGERIARHVVGVGALAPGERHGYSLSVELIPAAGAAPGGPAAANAPQSTADRRG